ncbi:MAG: copper-binding protein [Cephaloticoccus sp.]|nr:copper-binding protein [Cephaloticoccus sp.]MCF7760548.1 copper-binding protein [Cephaloticoccus sp.]
MRSKLSALLAFFLVAASPALAACPCGDDCACGKNCTCEKTDSAPAEVTHPLQGVVKAVMADRGMLLVKHEEIPGVMGAMTMAFRVDEATLTAAQKDVAVTGLLVKRDGKFWLIDAKFASAATK